MDLLLLTIHSIFCAFQNIMSLTLFHHSVLRIQCKIHLPEKKKFENSRIVSFYFHQILTAFNKLKIMSEVTHDN